MNKEKIQIYTDGSCRGNGKENNSGGYGIVVVKNNNILYLYQEKSNDTTNNREELKAIIYALKLAREKYSNFECEIYSDSSYCVNICNYWIWSWFNKGWVRYGNKPIENLDLIKEIFKYINIDFNNFVIKKVKGHNGDQWNELADVIATGKSLEEIKKEYLHISDSDILFTSN